MKTDKNWADALREQCYPQEVTPSEGSWAGIRGKMHRRAVRRWSMAAILALLFPLGGLLLYGPKTVQPSLAAGDRLVLAPEPSLLACLPEARVRPIASRQEPVASLPPEGPVVTAAAPSGEESAVPVPEEPVLPPQEQPAQAVEEDGAPFPEDPVVPSAPRKHRWSVSAQVGSGAGQMDTYPLLKRVQQAGLATKSGEAFWINMQNSQQVLQQLHYRHDIPLSVGITFRSDFTSWLALESGLTYTYLHSYEEQLGDQQLHLMGIPLKLDFRLFSFGPLDLGVGGYGMAEKCLYAVQGGIRFEEPDIQWSAGAFLDAGFRMGSFATLYVQPSLTYYFNETCLITYRTENRLGFMLQAGLRFHL